MWFESFEIDSSCCDVERNEKEKAEEAGVLVLGERELAPLLPTICGLGGLGNGKNACDENERGSCELLWRL